MISATGGGGGGSGTVNSGTAGQLAYYASTGTGVSGDADATISGGELTLGVAGTAAGKLALSGSTSGTTTLQSAAAASGTLTLPAATDTLVGRATTDTLTNKTLTSPTLGGTVTGPDGGTWTSGGINGSVIGATTPEAVSATTLSLARHAVANTNYTVAAGISIVAYTSISATRTVTLPAASSYAAGQQLLVLDESGSCSATLTITINSAGSDTINGVTSAVIAGAYGALTLESNGSNAWTIVNPVENVEHALVGIGTAPDPNNPLSVYGVAALFSSAGNFNVTVNKGGSGGNSLNTASFIFEDGFSGRGQIGLCGNDNFTFKVSNNGSTWNNGIIIDAATGALTIGNSHTAVSDANYTALTTDRTIGYSAITVARTVSLPSSSSFPTGTANELTVIDESGACTSSLSITVSANGSDTINGKSNVVIGSGYGYVTLMNNGSGKWTITAAAAPFPMAVAGGNFGGIM